MADDLNVCKKYPADMEAELVIEDMKKPRERYTDGVIGIVSDLMAVKNTLLCYIQLAVMVIIFSCSDVSSM